MNAKSPFKATSLNWDASGTRVDGEHAPLLNPRDIIQVAFVLEGDQAEAEVETESTLIAAGDERLILGQLNIQWRSAMGDRGFLSTGWLTGRKRS
jgi:trafficking protein particle complex subunit 13